MVIGFGWRREFRQRGVYIFHGASELLRLDSMTLRVLLNLNDSVIQECLWRASTSVHVHLWWQREWLIVVVVWNISVEKHFDMVILSSFQETLCQ